MIGNSNNKINFSSKSLLTNRQILRLRKDFGNSCSANITSKAQLFIIGQSKCFTSSTVIKNLFFFNARMYLNH